MELSFILHVRTPFNWDRLSQQNDFHLCPVINLLFGWVGGWMLVTSTTASTKPEPETCTENGVNLPSGEREDIPALHVSIYLPCMISMRITEIAWTYLYFLLSYLTACFESKNDGQSMILFCSESYDIGDQKMCF
jgi:hypothetical protein